MRSLLIKSLILSVLFSFIFVNPIEVSSQQKEKRRGTELGDGFCKQPKLKKYKKWKRWKH